MGWKPYEYYTSSPYEFFTACEGYFDKVDAHDQKLRLCSYRIHQSLVEKPLRIEDFWPMKGDKKRITDEYVMTPEMYEQIKKAHGLN